MNGLNGDGRMGYTNLVLQILHDYDYELMTKYFGER